MLGPGAFNLEARQAWRVRTRVETNWRTQLLLLFAFVVAGVIAWNRVQARLAEQDAEAEGAAAAETTDVVDVEIVAD